MIGAGNLARTAYSRPPQSGSYPAGFEYSNDVPLFNSPAIKKTSSDNQFMTFRRGFSNLFPTATEVRGQGTVEFWFNRNGTPSNNSFLFDIQEVSTEIAILGRTNGGVSARCRFGTTTVETGIVPVTNATWRHIAITLDDNRFLTLWVDGNRGGVVGNGTDTLVTSGGQWWRLGTHFYSGALYFREFRVSRIPRYDRNNTTYTVPTAPFVNDEHTHMLFHLDGSDAGMIPQFVDDVGA